MTGTISSKVRIVKCPRCRRVLPEPADVLVYECGGCGTRLQAKKRNNGATDSTSRRPDEDSSGKQKAEQVIVDQEAGSISIQESQNSSANQSDKNSGQNDLHSSNKDQDAAKRAENGTVDEPSNVVEEHSSEKLERKQLSDDQEPCYNSVKQSLVNSSNELDQNIHNDPRSSTEFSGHEDPESSSEAKAHNGFKRDETEFITCRKETESEDKDTSSEFEKAIETTKIISDFDAGSKSSFKTMIAEKLLDTRQKKPVHFDEDDDLLSEEDESADLHHHHISRRRFDRFSSLESIGTNHYEYEGSVSSFDGIENQNPRKHHTGSIRSENINSGNKIRSNRINYEHRSTNFRSIYGLNEFYKNPRHRSPVIPENPKLERIELLNLVRELQDQLERTNFSNAQSVPLYGRRRTFSGEETAASERRYGGECHRCCLQDCSNGPNYGPKSYGSGYGPKSYCSPVFSSPSSPGRRNNPIESDFSASDDYWQRNGIRRACSPKKRRYVRPIAGGGPWIACYLCSKILQLPQSFLLFNKRCHSLRCGACLKVLKFTLLNGTRVIRYYPEDTIAAPPSSEAGDYDKLNGVWAEPVSCSDRSFEKSYSTETDRNGSREMSRETSGSTRPPSSKVSGRRRTTSEIKEVEPGNHGSPLHWLMGYASPSKVIRG